MPFFDSISYSWQEVEFARNATTQLVLVSVSAVVAYLCDRRWFLIVTAIGTSAGWIPLVNIERSARVSYSSASGAVMGALNDAWVDFVLNAVIGCTICWTVVFVFGFQRYRSPMVGPLKNTVRWF